MVTSTVRSIVALFAFTALPAVSLANEPFLLYGNKNVFYGCLNCSRFDDVSVCNQFGEHGSEFTSGSIWNSFGDGGSKFSDDSPWNKFSEGLKVIDSKGNYYGRLSINKFATDRMTVLDQWFDFYERLDGDLEALRKLVCGK